MITSEFIVNVFDDIIDGEPTELCRTYRMHRDGSYMSYDLDHDWRESSAKARKDNDDGGRDLQDVLTNMRELGWTVDSLVTSKFTW